DGLARSEAGSTRDADIREPVAVAFKEKTLVAERLISTVAAEAYMYVAERWHTEQLAAGAEILCGGGVENLLVAQESGRLAVRAGDVEAIVIAGLVAGFGDLAPNFAERARDLAGFGWRIVRPASGGEAAKFVGGEMKRVNLVGGYLGQSGVIG